MPHQWREAGENWNNNATIIIFERENDYIDHVCSQTNCESVWISIDATNTNFNTYAGEYEFHSIVNNVPAYRNAKNYYLAYDESHAWYITSEERFLDGISGGWFRIYSKGILKNVNI